MAKFLAYYIVADSQYKHGKLRSITGDDNFFPVNDPTNPPEIPASETPPGIDGLIDADKHRDTLPFSYINDEGVPEVLVCNVFTPPPSPPEPDGTGTGNPLTSTGRYTVIVPTLISGPEPDVYWRVLPNGKGRNITLVVTDGNGNQVEVAGNPQAVIKIGQGYLLILGYDSTVVYRVSLAALKNTDNDGVCEVEEAIDLMAGPARDITVGDCHHGTALLPMADPDGAPYVFGLFSNTAEDGEGWITTHYESTLVRCTVTDPNAAALSYDASALVGTNSIDMDKYTYLDIDYILISAIGGRLDNNGFTNAGSSHMAMVDAFDVEAGFDNMKYMIQGDGGDVPQPVTQEGTYDVHFLAVTEDGSNALLGTLSYDEAYRACWRYYTADLAGLAYRATDPNNDVSISTLVDLNLLTPVDSGFEEEAGYYWEGAMLNAGNQLWTMKGNSIRVCAADDYNALIKEINAGNGTLYDTAFNINFLDLIGELLYQEEEPAKKKPVKLRRTRLGKHRMLARHVRAAKNAAKQRARAKAAEEAAAKAKAAAKTAEHPTEENAENAGKDK
jgi:hypothetical protein